MTLRLITPSLEAIASYRSALERGWSPDTMSDAAISRELAAIDEDPAKFIGLMDDPHARGGPVTLPDGTQVARLPGFRRWLWDGEFAGSFSFRHQPGTEALPPYILGHVGYSVPPWKRGRGYATSGLGKLLGEIAGYGLRHVMLTADPANEISQRVITGNGGYLVERFVPSTAYGEGEKLRWRIDLPNRSSGAEA